MRRPGHTLEPGASSESGIRQGVRWSFRAWVREIEDLLFPRACLGCAGHIPPEEGHALVCGRCLSLLRRAPPPRCTRCDAPLGTGAAAGGTCWECSSWPDALATARSAVLLEHPADSLVHALKYGGWRPLAPLMARWMCAVLPETSPGRPLVVVPVATTSARRRRRGYNQAEALAVGVSAVKGLPMAPVLLRVRGDSQVGKGPAERRRSVEGVFRVVDGGRSRIAGREVILIDDVLTTGATAASAAGALREGGAEGVHLLTFARALPFESDGRRPFATP